MFSRELAMCVCLPENILLNLMPSSWTRSNQACKRPNRVLIAQQGVFRHFF